MNSIYNPGMTLVNYTKIADEAVNNSDVLQDDDELKDIPLEAASTYLVYFSLLYASSAVADFKLDLLFSQNVDGQGNSNVNNTAGGTGSTGIQRILNTTSLVAPLAVGGLGAATQALAMICMVIRTTLACTFNVRFAQNTAEVSDSKMLAGSQVSVIKLQ